MFQSLDEQIEGTGRRASPEASERLIRLVGIAISSVVCMGVSTSSLWPSNDICRVGC